MPMPAFVFVLCLPGRRQTTLTADQRRAAARPRRIATTTFSPIASGLRVGKKIPPSRQLGQVAVEERRSVRKMRL